MIDKVNIITSHVQNGKMLGWSPYLRYENGIDWIEIANTLPLPSDKEAEISELPVIPEEVIENDKSFEVYRYKVDLKNYQLMTLAIFHEIKLQTVINDLILLFNTNKIYDQRDKGLFLVLYNEVFNKELTYGELNKLDNDKLNTILEKVNELFEKRLLLAPHQLINSEKKLRLLSVYLNTIKDSLVKYLPGEERIAEVLKKIVDYHNLYMSKWKNSRRREAYENFISKTMWLISGDPRNWILGLISVDTSTGPWKDLAGGSESAEASKRLTGNSAYGLINLLVLTLEGRLNVGIVANSLKAFEAATQALYSILEEGDPEKIQQIFVDLQIGSKQISSIANLWVKDPVFNILNEKEQKILLAFASSDDAYIELSSLLSLAVDNAKDPTLSKINGNKNMIGLYTAGLIAGLSKEELISIINSKSGELISDYLTSNIFNSHKKYFKDPIKVFQHLYSQTPENLKVPNEETELGQQLKAILTKKGDDGFYISESERIDQALALIKDNNDDSYKTFKNELYSLKEIANIKEFDLYKAPDGTRHSCFRALYKIARVNAEFKNLMIATGLNLGYANSIEDLFDFAYRFANILSQFKTYGNFKKDDDTDLQTLREINDKLNIPNPKDNSASPKIDLVSYVENPIFYILGNTIITLDKYDTESDDIKSGYTPISYRQAVRNYYQEHKYLINIFDVFELSLLYKGYLEGMGAVIKGSSAISTIHKSINEALNPVIDTLKVSKKLDRKYVIKKIEQYFHIKRTKLFWEKLGNEFTFTVNYKGYTLKNVALTSERNREIFKNYFETVVFPALQSKFSDNKFISSLYVKLLDYPDHSIGRKLVSHVSTRLVNPLDKLRFLEVKQDIARLQSELFNGTSIMTLFFVYDLVTTNGLNIPHNLAPFFEDLRYTDRNLFIIKYEDFVKNPKDHNNKSIVTWFELEELELICQFCAPEVLSLSDTKYKYVYITDRNTKKYALYEHIDASQQDTVLQTDLLNIEIDEDSYIDDNVDNDVLDLDDSYNEDNFSEELDNGVRSEDSNKNYKLVNKKPDSTTLNAQVLLANIEILYNTYITSNDNISEETKKILQNLIDANLDALSLALAQNC